MPDLTTKQCTLCKRDLPHASFWRDKDSRDGLGRRCKECHGALNRDWERRHRKERAAKQRQRISANREKERRRYKQVYERRKHTPEYRARMRLRSVCRRARRQGHPPGSMLHTKYRQQRGKCYWCKAPLGDVYHVDHVIPLSRGGTNDLSNLVLACPPCNLSKNDRLPHEWPGSGRLL